ncbi:uncharacterized protein LY79DRAFT_23569 [Colletotrichum navitas]|uniref:Uncharacterized protein n=1 Tax=Colletotrichum navitas TaxID=681940 RepID=A0AAD8VCW1_9PEZI|nr:uncharacterized protein LY79DRAFT_23569 [Colletotrichum navitas]KAK1600543.1 hypothetical protein LY79DRAFT_23569 [Colletotrichum navitas]
MRKALVTSISIRQAPCMMQHSLPSVAVEEASSQGAWRRVSNSLTTNRHASPIGVGTCGDEIQ